MQDNIPDTIDRLYGYVMKCSHRLERLRELNVPDNVLEGEERLLDVHINNLWDACQAERN